jgi:hypothetical protein
MGHATVCCGLELHYLLTTMISMAGNGGQERETSLQRATGHQSLFNK